MLPTAVPNKSISINGVDQFTLARQLAMQEIDGFEWTVCDEFIQEDMFGIPEVERFKWSEDVLRVLDEQNKLGNNENDAYLALKRYERLAEVIIEEGKKADE